MEPLGQLFHHRAALIVAHGKPVPDFRQGTAAAAAKPAGLIVSADFDAGAFHLRPETNAFDRNAAITLTGV